MSLATLLVLALLLDAAFGEPEALWSRLPHPAVVMGRIIATADRRFNTGPRRKAAGIAVMTGLGLAALATGWLLSHLPGGPLIEALLAAILLAQRSLTQHVSAVASALRRSLEAGRASVGMIVGRDTAALTEPAVARAAIESAAENLSDGVIAPALWFLIGGLPGLLLYKITNTADSMIGHRTPRHEQFGWAAARFDDLLNLIPARLTALLIALTYAPLRDWPRIWPKVGSQLWPQITRDAALHRSPNAGWPEAAMAIALNTALSGPRSYDGQMQDFPWVWEQGNRSPGPDQIDACTRVLWRAWGLGLALVTLIALV
ncbi:CobD/CbiB family cobalamin biosynthesis protein [Pseudoruegeria sp. SK021]|uniref:cobalamin biosynthesis protein CobD/CbiB n=1 Tax=Pseudoruegeria sp. SK021 TaxID=1933035 RepID=UPI000A252E02|nr:CobD/CbiB family cobalamin biosynthesis protein [Pseudoruegeria sp. SK021]OSP53744.1 adenosylcobinamide-phosphate synthase [Pseudoruegeria sp. SK021]